MSYAIFKLSYNEIGDSKLEGGICGSGFFINRKTFVTAHHVLNSKNLYPNIGYLKCQYWLFSREGDIIELNINDMIITDFPEIDTTSIQFEKNMIKSNNEIELDKANVNEAIKNLGYIGSNMPILKPLWEDKLKIQSVNLSNSISDATGYIRNIKKATIKSNDVNISGKTLLITSYPGIIGMSGGALLNSKNKIIGLMSIGLPPNKNKKDNLGAIWIKEVIEILDITIA